MSSTREGRSASPDDSRSPVRGRHRARSLSKSRSPVRGLHRSRSLSKSRSPVRDPHHSRSNDPEDVRNPGNNLYVTGLSVRVTEYELEKFFSKEGKVLECQVVMDPHTKESRGFGFVTMEKLEDADRCIKHLHRSVLEGRLITVEKAKRKCGRTPTPGRYEGPKDKRVAGNHNRRRSRSYSPPRRFERGPYPGDRRGGPPPRVPYGGYNRRADDYPSSYRRADDYPNSYRRADDYSSSYRRADDYSSSYRRRGGY